LNINDFGAYICHALKSPDDECVRLGCGILSDISNALKDGISQYLKDFVPLLFVILKDSN